MITLASSSPRRISLLKVLFKDIEAVNPNVDESVLNGESAIDMVLRLSKAKADSVKRNNAVIAADTTVEIGGMILGKPQNRDNAIEMLKTLSGKWHTVHTGVRINFRDESIGFVESTKVKFHILDEEIIKEYVKNSSFMDKAGAYGIQDDMGMVLVDKIEGDFFNIVGLPISKVWWEFRKRKIV